jgi:uncharacterized iron-regulated protein
MVINQMASFNPQNNEKAIPGRMQVAELSTLIILLGYLVTGGIWGCTGMSEGTKDVTSRHKVPGAPSETIMDTKTGRDISYGQLIEHLSQVRIVYVGEHHTNVRHHEIQLEIIRTLAALRPNIVIGMEMFDRSYQPKLERWTAGQMTWDEFLKQVHWYANWKYSSDLYRDILDYIRSRQLQLVGLNIPFCLPSKIAIGGLASLSAAERAQLPQEIDTTQGAHREYIAAIFEEHHFTGKSDFEFFYEAQCAWEDGMAQAIADQGEPDMMVVLVGNGHIVRKFGIPERAHKRLALPYRTVYLATHGMTVTAEDADFIWTTASATDRNDNPHR